ncbi:MAG: nucleoside-diphosphate kinase [Planctomycetota bacterium]|nr:nucleoside-diphosphate kinase [Planctomycetota bacterium]
MERTLIIVKPDAVERRLVGEIIQRLEKKALKIIGLKLEKLARETVEKHYEEHRERPFFGELVEFMSGGPVVLLAVEGPGAVAVCRKLVGATAAYEADPGSLRGDLGLSKQFNLVHASDSLRAAERELSLFFEEREIEEYTLPDEAWW